MNAKNDLNQYRLINALTVKLRKAFGPSSQKRHSAKSHPLRPQPGHPEKKLNPPAFFDYFQAPARIILYGSNAGRN